MAAFIGGGKDYSQDVEGGFDADGASAEAGGVGVAVGAGQAGLGGVVADGGADAGVAMGADGHAAIGA